MTDAVTYVVVMLLTGSVFVAGRSVSAYLADRRARVASIRRRLRD